MANDLWMIRGTQYVNCNCDVGCPCQFGSPTTHGLCHAIASGIIDEGYFNATRLDGLKWAMVVSWPGEIAEGNGTLQPIVDERADAAQREALRKIICGESTAPGSTHFYVFASTMSRILETRAAAIEITVDIDGRTATLRIPGIADSTGGPIISAFTGEPVRSGIHLPGGFEYSYAEIGKGSSTVSGDIAFTLEDSHSHYNVLHLNQDGVVRSGIPVPH